MEATTTASPASSTQASFRTKYGKSCTNCSKAKCKCSYLTGCPSCERCDRLNKQCKPLVSLRTGAPQSTTHSPEPNHDNALNSKLDELILLLTARRELPSRYEIGQANEDLGVVDGDHSTNAPGLSLPMHLRLDPTALSELTDDATASTTFSDVSHLNRGQPKDIPVPKLPVSPEQATRCFTRFRCGMLPWMPFMYVSETTTVIELQRMWPMLHVCIMATAANSTSQLHAWSEDFRLTIVKKLYESGERSLDLLLAILTFIGWLRHHRQERPFFNLWLHMAVTLVSDLGLDKRAQTDNIWWPWHRESVNSEQSAVEQRAVLAVFVLSSTSASSIKSVESLDWTPHMDTFLQSLEDYPEWYGDRILAVQARCCLITEALNRIVKPTWPFSSQVIADALGPILYSQAEAIMVLEQHISQLKDKVKVLGLDKHPIVSMSIVTTELDIHETAANPAQPYAEQNLTTEEKLTRYQNQLACLKHWWDVFLTINSQDFPDVSFPVMTQLIHCIVSLFRLTTLQYPGWNTQLVRNTADVTEHLSSFALIVERGHDQVGLTCDRGDDLLTKTTKTMRKLRQYFLNILIMIDPTSRGIERSPFHIDETIPDMMDLDFWSSQWLTDMIMSWEK